MNIKNFIADDNAVSPVIGVILMVAITVILAAVIGAFVLGFGGGGPSAPSVSWDTSDDGATSNPVAVEFSHGGGDTITEATNVLQAGGDANTISATDNNLHDCSDKDNPSAISSELTTGDSVCANADTGDDEVTLVWNSPDSDSTQELSSHNL